MNAPNLVYATVAGMYPRLLADDGIHEVLVLPYDVDSVVQFEFYREGSATTIRLPLLFARYIRPDGTTVNLTVDTFTQSVIFPATLPAGGVCVIDLDEGRQCYPFRVLRASEVLTP